MAYVRANLFYERESWKKPLWYSVGFHSLLVLAIILTAFVYGHRPVNAWGMNNGQAVQATLVSASSLPIPHAESAMTKHSPAWPEPPGRYSSPRHSPAGGHKQKRSE